MCGIAGFWTTRAGGDRRAQLEAMLSTIEHRGPDGHGQHLVGDGGPALGHTRLSIIGLESGEQPIHGPQRVLTANGELYGYKKIRAELVRTGVHFQTRSDSEIALHLYGARGLDFVEALRGEFALALYDAARERLVLVRDRFGVKPLHFHAGPEGVYWASEIKALLAHPGVPRRLCARGAMGQMMNLMVPGATGFDSIRKLRPGHMLIVEREGDRLRIRERRYWDLDFPAEGERAPPGDEAETAAAIGRSLIDAISVRLEADVPVACYLSGGIDSCSIIGLASALQQSPVTAFTISFDHDAYDESGPARRMAKRAGAEQVILKLGAEDLYGEAYVEAVRHAERAFYNPFSVAKLHMSRTVRDHGYKVVITGEGSDELFAGYPFFKLDMLRHAAAGGGEALAQVGSDNAVFRGATIAAEAAAHPALDHLLGFTPAWIQPWIHTLARARELFTDDVARALVDYDPVTAFVETLDPERLHGRHVLDQVQYTYVKTLLESQVLGWSGDRMDMAHGMESRPAFLDHRLAELAVQVPPGWRIRDGIEKWILREAMRHVLPRELYERQKFAFMAPPAHTDRRKRAAVGALSERYLSPTKIGEVGLFDSGRVAAFLSGLSRERDRVTATRDDVILNHLLGIHILHDELLARPSSAA